jgi:hypothetical protein
MKKIMNKISILMVAMLCITACSVDLDQVPPNLGDSGSVTDYEPVLLAAYGYHHDAVAPMAVMGDFRSDNALFDETPFTDFGVFNNNLTGMSSDFFRPFYVACYKSIISANEVISNSSDAATVGEAKFLRALSYFKLVRVFGDVTVFLEEASAEGIAETDLTRKAKADVYTDVIIPDLQAAKSALSALSASAANGRATSIAAQGLLGKVYATIGNYGAAKTELSAVINNASSAGIELESDFANVFGSDNDLNSEILFATTMSSTATLSTIGGEIYTNWYAGQNTKADEDAPMSQDLIDAFAASAGDKRAALTIDGNKSVKYASGTTTDADWIELRLADVIMLYAEALNETGSSAEDVLDVIDPIRTRAGLAALDHATINTEALVRQAILNERRLEFACEGQRWFDLVRFDAAQPGILNAEMGETISSNYHVFPVPVTEVTSFDQIEQNAGY